MKAFAVAALSVLGLAGSVVVAQIQTPTPPGISAAEWIPIGDNFGFVVTSLASPAAGRDSDRLAGYFIARHGNTWKRVDSEGGFRFQPLQK